MFFSLVLSLSSSVINNEQPEKPHGIEEKMLILDHKGCSQQIKHASHISNKMDEHHTSTIERYMWRIKITCSMKEICMGKHAVCFSLFVYRYLMCFELNSMLMLWNVLLPLSYKLNERNLFLWTDKEAGKAGWYFSFSCSAWCIGS